jgi:hypothetical protein
MKNPPKGATHKYKKTNKFYKINENSKSDKFAMWYCERVNNWFLSRFTESVIIENKLNLFEKV